MSYLATAIADALFAAGVSLDRDKVLPIIRAAILKDDWRAPSETITGRMVNTDGVPRQLVVSLRGICGSLDVVGGLLTKTNHGQEVEITFRPKVES